MFDYVKTPEIPCPDCGEPLTGFQSKDGPCQLEEVDFWQVDFFYTHCQECKRSVSFLRDTPKPEVPLTHYRIVGDTRGPNT